MFVLYVTMSEATITKGVRYGKLFLSEILIFVIWCIVLFSIHFASKPGKSTYPRMDDLA